MKKDIIKKLKKTINNIRPIPAKNASSLRMSMNIAKEYLIKAQNPTGENTTGGMLRGSTLHLKNFERELIELEMQGFCVEKYKREALKMREMYNFSFLRALLSSEKSHYEEELIEEGFLIKL